MWVGKTRVVGGSRQAWGMPVWRSRKEPYLVGEDVIVVGGLQKAMTLPPAVAALLQEARRSGQPWGRLLAETLGDRTLAEPQAEEQLFPLRLCRPDGYANSVRAESYLHRHGGALTVLDGLHQGDIAALPRRGALLFLGDGSGGFYAPTVGEGRIPCARCLLLRYLAGRQSSPLLYRVVQSGTRVGFANAPKEQSIPPEADEAAVTVFGSHAGSWNAVLPLPDCPACLHGRSPDEPLLPGLFAPVARLVTHPPHHAAHLPQMLWLSGQETIGGGGAHDEESERGALRACHEALERYAAHFVPAATSTDGVLFESRDGPQRFSRRRALLTEPGSVSTGLACHERLEVAIEHALAEVCERDALARLWLGLGRGTARLARLGHGESEGLRYELYALDSYRLPVVLCLAHTEAGHVVTGSAGGEQAATKALAECRQNAAFLRLKAPSEPPDKPETFLEHAALYWHGRCRFPLLDAFLVERLEAKALEPPVYHCDLTPGDVRLLGKSVVRVQVPGLLHLPMSHHDWSAVLEEAGFPGPPPELPHPFL